MTNLTICTYLLSKVTWVLSPESSTTKFFTDNLVNQRVLAQQLRKTGAIVDVANHGVEALTHVESTKHWTASPANEKELSVILMDWEMPVMNGVTCVKRIRELQCDGSIGTHIPIIGTTANARAIQIEEAKQAGMVSGSQSRKSRYSERSGTNRGRRTMWFPSRSAWRSFLAGSKLCF